MLAFEFFSSSSVASMLINLPKVSRWASDTNSVRWWHSLVTSFSSIWDAARCTSIFIIELALMTSYTWSCQMNSIKYYITVAVFLLQQIFLNQSLNSNNFQCMEIELHRPTRRISTTCYDGKGAIVDQPTLWLSSFHLHITFKFTSNLQSAK